MKSINKITYKEFIFLSEFFVFFLIASQKSFLRNELFLFSFIHDNSSLIGMFILRLDLIDINFFFWRWKISLIFFKSLHWKTLFITIIIIIMLHFLLRSFFIIVRVFFFLREFFLTIIIFLLFCSHSFQSFLSLFLLRY